MSDQTHLVVLCTAPNAETADRLARGLVEERLAACVNIITGVQSVYRWDGKVNAEAELQLVIKTSARRFEQIRVWLAAEHPYDVPEIVALPIVAGSAGYLEWIDTQTAG